MLRGHTVFEGYIRPVQDCSGSTGVYVCLIVGGSAVDGINPASPEAYYTTTLPRVWVLKVMQDFYHQIGTLGSKYGPKLGPVPSSSLLRPMAGIVESKK